MTRICLHIALLGCLTILLHGQTPDAAIASLTGQPMILPKLGEHAKINYKKSQLDRIKGSCDVAVLVSHAEWRQGLLRLDLQLAGRASITNQKPGICRTLPHNIAVELSGFTPGEPVPSLLAAIGQVLQTPEQYLTSHGIPFSLPPGPDDEAAMKLGPSAIAPKPLLRVDGAFTDQAQRAKWKGRVVIRLTVGTDGRAHHLQLVRQAGLGLDESALKAMLFWRFEPGTQDGKPLPVLSVVEMNFDIF